MFKNYFKIAIRNLWRNKGFSAINISGLAVGMAAAVLILLWIQNEWSHDRFHQKGDRIYMMCNLDKFSGALHAWNTTPKPLAPALKAEMPDVEDAVRFSRTGFLFTVGEKRLNVQGAFTDSGFLNVFSFPLLKGAVKTSLAGNNSIVITQMLAQKLFGKEEAMGRTIRIDSTDNFTVTGVLKDLPNNTIFNFEYLLPWNYMSKLGWNDSAWGNNSVSTYALLKPGVLQARFDEKVKSITINHADKSEQNTTQVFTQPLTRMWLYGRSENGKFVGGRSESIKMFGIVAAFILLIACINFMNLSTARSEKRAKEVGIRKVVGAQKGSLIAQFIGESVIIAFLAGLLAVIIVEVSLPAFNTMVNKNLFIDFSQPFYWIFALLFILFTGLLAGSYPAFYLSSFQPVKIFKGTFKAANALLTPRKILVVLQFTFAIILIICTMIVNRQLHHAQQRDNGYSKDHLIYTLLQGDMEKHYDAIKTELINSGAAVAVTKSMGPVTQHSSDSWGFEWEGSTEGDKKVDFLRMSSTSDFAKTMGVSVVEGRDIDIKAYPSDSTALVMNEAAVKAMRLKNPVGELIKDNDRTWHVVGVVNDFIIESPYEPVAPMLLCGPAAWFNAIHIKLNSNKPVADALQRAEAVFKTYNPQYPFDYKFIDEDYAAKFDNEKRASTLATLFAAITIFISCLGLFGLATYMAANRVKEIGVRKVLGASVTSITALLSKDFLKLVILSFIVASPVAWYAMSKWLQSYTYRVSIQWWVFAGAGILSVLIALFTVSYQAIKAAMANPVASLRSE